MHHVPEILEAMPTTNANSWPCSPAGQWQTIRIAPDFHFAHQCLQPANTGTWRLSLPMAFPEIERHGLAYVWARKRKGRANKVMFKIARVTTKYSA